MNYTYIVECADKSLYTGWTTDVRKRLQAHNCGKGAKYTRSRRPVRLVYVESHDTKEEAMRREYAIKQLSREDKLRLIEKGTPFQWQETKEGNTVTQGETNDKDD